MINLQRSCFFCLLLLLVSGCKKPDKLYLVPIGGVSSLDVEGLANHYREKFGIEARVLERMQPRASDVDAGRQQLIAENLIDAMLSHYSEYASDKMVVLIGITDQDMYPQSENWGFCFGWRGGNDRAAVVSTARMNLHYPGEPADEAELYKRLRKMVTRDIGLLYYRKSTSSDPHSVLYSNVGGIQELDQMSEDF